MKNKTIRPGVYETNSSSCHSLTISLGELNQIPNVEELLLHRGEFGWEWETYTSFTDKLNYCYTLAKEVAVGGDLLTMLKEVLFENIPTLKTITEDDKVWGYVDHQSMDLIDEVFESKQSLAAFLFCRGSDIRTGNDNEY